MKENMEMMKTEMLCSADPLGLKDLYFSFEDGPAINEPVEYPEMINALCEGCGKPFEEECWVFDNREGDYYHDGAFNDCFNNELIRRVNLFREAIHNSGFAEYNENDEEV